jgi:hypothetical protein
MTPLLIAVALACMAAPAPSDLSVQIGKIFEVVESAGTVGSPRTAVQQKLAKLLPSPGDDHRVRYAYVVALIHEHRYPDALREVNTLLKSQPKYLPGHHARVWLLLTLRKYPEGLTALEALAKALPKEEATGEEELANIEAAQFLGTGVGYFEGPGETRIKTPVRAQVEARIQARLSGKRREAYDAQVKAVAELFAEIRAGGEQATSNLKQAKQSAADELESKQTALAKARSDTTAKAEATAEQLRARWNLLNSELAQLRTNYAELTAQSVAMRNQRIAAASELATLELNSQNKNTTIAQQASKAYIRHGPQYRQNIYEFDLQLARAAVAMEEMVKRGVLAEAQMEQLVVAGQNVGETFAVQERTFGKQEKALGLQKKKVAKQAIPNGPKIRVRELDFNAYDEFSYETEKHRILESLSEM